MAKSVKRPLAAALLTVVLVIVLIAVVYWFNQSGPHRPNLPGLTPAEAQKLIAAKNLGLAFLENAKLDDAHQTFQPIARQLPTEPLGLRNLAVARVLALGIDYDLAPPEAVGAASDALAAMQRLEGDSLAWHWLALRVSLAGGDFAAAQTHMTAIEAETPGDAAAWYTHYRVLKLQDPQEQQAATSAALDKAWKLDSTNAWLLAEWLRSQATRLDREVDRFPEGEAEKAAALASLSPKLAALADQLDAARPTAQAFAHVIRAHTQADVLVLLDQAVNAARAGEPVTVIQRLRVVANVLLPHAAPDQQPLRRHPLEFALDRFSPQFYQQAKVAEQPDEPPIAVSFAATPGWQLSAERAQELGAVRDVALVDFDLDGRIDLVVLGQDEVVIYGRAAEAQPWRVLASAAATGAKRLLATDLDNDFDETRQAVERQAVEGQPKPEGETPLSPALRNGCPSADVDLVLYGDAGMLLIENRVEPTTGKRSLVPVASDKLPPLSTPIQAITVADLDADGDLDLVLATESGLALWSNTGEWTFADISSRSVLPSPSPATTELVALDWDRDVDIDLLVAAGARGGWLENLRHGQFRWRAFADAQPELDRASALAAVEADGNATWDFLAARADGIVFVADGPANQAKRIPAAAIDELVAQRLITWDYDNDGWDDCLALGAAAPRLLRGRGDGTFERAALLDKETSATAGDVGDLDNDGDLDLALVSQGKLNLRENQGGNANHWIDVALQAQQIKGGQHAPSGRVSPFGVGSLLELKAGVRYQAQVVTRPTTHFGLGRLPEADAIRVSWLNGVPQNIIRPAANLFVCEQQVLNTSCPYLYAWNGESFEFVTDLLWNAPLGLQLAEGQLAPAREWEYLKIPGEALAERDGHYWLQIAAELWEADYFDEVRLIAIDHPSDVEVYSNEKVGSAEMAAYKVHTVSSPRLPIAARGQSGRNLLPEIAKLDGVYARPFDRKLRQGVVEEHSLALELGNVPPAAKVTLFLTGWVFPASTSINVALSQGSSLSPPRPPSLEIQDEQGQWQPLLPFMGFPGGKTKTIAIELPSEQVQTHRSKSADSLRLRITTSMELYWDHIFFTVDEAPAQIRTTELMLVSAELHERGFSRVVPDPANGPEKFLYDDCSPLAKWPPMLGRFTRLGDVKELLTASDDHLLVMGAGDETTMRFAKAQVPLPPGWKRDFFLYSVGWDKDANLATILGQTVEPLPFRAMTAYPWPALETTPEKTPDSATYLQYLREYQTREQTPAYWRWFRSAGVP